jgi:hypothetical protein
VCALQQTLRHGRAIPVGDIGGCRVIHLKTLVNSGFDRSPAHTGALAVYNLRFFDRMFPAAHSGATLSMAELGERFAWPNVYERW